MQISVAEFTRDRKMMSVLCSRNQLQIMFLKGAPESIISRCTNVLCNDDGSTVPLTASTRAELDLRLQRSVPPPPSYQIIKNVVVVEGWYTDLFDFVHQTLSCYLLY